jgi:hypothetical protein
MALIQINAIKKPITLRLALQISFIILSLLITVLYFLSILPDTGIDFIKHFYPAGRSIWIGKSPYTIDGFYNPPWLLLLLTPLSLLPVKSALVIYMMVILGGFIVAVKRMGARPLDIIFIGFSPWLLLLIGYANIDWLVLLGATLPIQLGVWLVLLKPQMSLILILLWLRRSWRKGGVKQLIVQFGPVLVAFLLSYLLGLWQTPDYGKMQIWSADIWPYGIPIGLALAFIALKRDDDLIALAAAPFVSPYLSIFSWIVVLLPTLRKPRWLFILALLSWIGLMVWRITRPESWIYS